MFRTLSTASVRARVFMIATLALIPPLTLVAYTAMQWHRHEIVDAQENALGVVRHFASTFEHEINGAERMLITVGHVMSAVQDEDEVVHVLNTALNDHPRYRTIGAIPREGVVLSVGDRVDSRKLESPVFVRAQESGTFAAGAWEFDSENHRATATFVLPRGHAGSHGIVFAVMDLGWLPRLGAGNVLLPAGSAITLADHRGRIIGRWPEADWAGRWAAGDPAISPALGAAREGVLEATSRLDGVPRIVAFTPLRGFSGGRPLYLSIGVPRSAATVRSDRILLQDLGVFAGAILFCLAGITLLSSRVVVPFLEAPVRVERQQNADLLATNAALQGEVAERRRAEEAVEKLSRAIEQTADSVLITNPDGVIEYVNPSFEQMTGFNRAEAIGQTPRLMKSGVHPSAFYQALWTTLLSGQTFRSTMRNRRRNGELYDEDQTISPVRDGSGEITHFVSTGRDITQRRRMEAALRRLNTALEQEATRIAGILHDEAGQFLTAAHMSLADLARETTPHVSERLQKVRWHLDQVEGRLRHMSHELHPRVVQDLGLVEAVNFFVDGFTRRTGIAVQVESSILTRFPISVEAIVYRVVQEGLTNVHRHARASRALVKLQDDGKSITCTVGDNGSGLSTSAQGAPCDEGSLGLRIMRDRVEAAGGTLTVSSNPGTGAELRVTVPVEV